MSSEQVAFESSDTVILRKMAAYETLLAALMNRAWMRHDFREADEIATALGLPLPSQHEDAKE